MADDFIFTPKETVAEYEDEIRRLEKFKNLVYRIESLWESHCLDSSFHAGTIMREIKQTIADYEDHLFMEETTRDLFEEIDRMESK